MQTHRQQPNVGGPDPRLPVVGRFNERSTVTHADGGAKLKPGADDDKAYYGNDGAEENQQPTQSLHVCSCEGWPEHKEARDSEPTRKGKPRGTDLAWSSSRVFVLRLTGPSVAA